MSVTFSSFPGNFKCSLLNFFYPGGIPSGQKKPFNYEHLNFPGKELNVTDITEQ